MKYNSSHEEEIDKIGCWPTATTNADIVGENGHAAYWESAICILSMFYAKQNYLEKQKKLLLAYANLCLAH